MWESDLQCQSTVSKNVQPCRNVTWVGWRNAAERVTWMTGNLSSSGMLLKTRQLTITPCKSHSHTVSLQWDIPACGKMWKHSTFKKKKEREKKKNSLMARCTERRPMAGKRGHNSSHCSSEKAAWPLSTASPAAVKVCASLRSEWKAQTDTFDAENDLPDFFKIPCF